MVLEKYQSTFKRRALRTNKSRRDGVHDFRSDRTYGFDGVLKYKGFSLQGEWYWKNINRHSNGAPCVQTNPAGTACTTFAQIGPTASTESSSIRAFHCKVNGIGKISIDIQTARPAYKQIPPGRRARLSLRSDLRLRRSPQV